MREFLVFAKHRNFSAAAKELYITQPAMSMRIAGMEKELGFKLVNRSRGAELTPAGREFFAGCRAIVDEYDHMMDACRAADREQPPVRVRVSGTPAWLPLLLRGEPDASIDLVEVPIDRFFPLEELVRDVVDVSAIWDFRQLPQVLDYASEHHIVSQRIGEDRLCVCVPKDNQLAQKESLRSEDIAGSTILIPYNKWHDAMVQWTRSILGEDLNLQFRMVETSSVFEQQYIEMGDSIFLGNATVPIFQSRRDVVIFDKIDGRPLAIDLMAVYRADNANSKVAALVDRAANLAAEEAMAQ